MSTINLNRDEAVAIPFVISDPAGSLAGTRVTWSVAEATDAAIALHKQSALGASSADVEITEQSATEIKGLINVAVFDFTALPRGQYRASLWIDSGVEDDRCVTPGGADIVIIVPNVARS
jgi:hypothetical protein